MHDLMFAAAAVALTAAVAVTLPARDDQLAEGLSDTPACAAGAVTACPEPYAGGKP